MCSNRHQVFEGLPTQNRDGDASDPKPGELDLRYVPPEIRKHVQEILVDESDELSSDAPKGPSPQRSNVVPYPTEVR